MEELLQYTTSDLSGKVFFDFVSSEYLEKVHENMLADSQKPCDAVLINRTGSRLEVEIQSKSFLFGGKKIGVAAVRDITERKKIDKDRREHREILLKTFERAPMGIAVLHKDGRFFFWNSALERLTGLFRKEFRHLRVEEIVTRPEAKNFRKRFNALLESARNNYKFSTKIIKKDRKILDI